MTDNKELALLLRSKTALGRLVESEVHEVLAFLESIGFVRPAASSDDAPAPIDPRPAPPADIVPPLPPAPPVVPAA